MPRIFLAAHGAKVAAYARAAFDDPQRLSAWFRPEFFQPGPVLRFAVQALGAWGDAGDLDRLKRAVGDQALAEVALDALRRLEERLFRP